MRQRLYDLAHARAGDKGDTSILAVFAYDPADYPLLLRVLTAERVREHFHGMVLGAVTRRELPGLHALTFVLESALGGGVTRTARLDAHGKCLSSWLLALEIEA
jgi:hypothetical protein